MKNIFFSIITCTKNSEKFILRNIKSVDKQIFRKYEQIFIDGDSNDLTKKIISEFVRKDNEKYRLFSFPPRGISNAFNKGIKKTSGQYLIFLNSDDFFYDTSVLDVVHRFLVKNTDCDWIYGKINVVEESGKSVGRYPDRKIYNFLPRYLLKFYNLIPHQAVFIRKTVFDKYGYFDENLKSSMDIDMWLRIINKTKWKFLNEIIANYTIRSSAQSSGMSNKLENGANLFKVAKRYMNFFEYIFFILVKKVLDRYNRTRR
jgi:glycosyltransferase involved in cell wall biosynthesis